MEAWGAEGASLKVWVSLLGHPKKVLQHVKPQTCLHGDLRLLQCAFSPHALRITSPAATPPFLPTASPCSATAATAAAAKPPH